MTFNIEPSELPYIRVVNAIANKVNGKLLFVVSGGLGDRVCAEPTLRYATDLAPKWGYTVSLACDTPELFRHLKFEKVIDMKGELPTTFQYMVFYTYPPTGLPLQFMNPNFMHCVDAASMMALRQQLPPESRQIFLFPQEPKDGNLMREILGPKTVVIHPGKTWATRTFPAQFWNAVIHSVRTAWLTPVLVGNSTVDVNPEGCLDLRGKTSLMDFAWICKNASRVVTNDSSPLHLAASGSAKIAFIASSRRPDLLLHTRQRKVGWRMKDFSVRPLWEEFDSFPNTIEQRSLAEMPVSTWNELDLPSPVRILNWLENPTGE